MAIYAVQYEQFKTMSKINLETTVTEACMHTHEHMHTRTHHKHARAHTHKHAHWYAHIYTQTHKLEQASQAKEKAASATGEHWKQVALDKQVTWWRGVGVLAGVPICASHDILGLQLKLDEALKRIANDEKRVSPYMASACVENTSHLIYSLYDHTCRRALWRTALRPWTRKRRYKHLHTHTMPRHALTRLGCACASLNESFLLGCEGASD
jgi:hypothetical protein